MKKTLTANISGTVFHIEEDAYESLNRYLATIRGQFAGSEGRDEIMADIESRIAELFTERLDGRRHVVSMGDVEHVIGIMGQPEDYVGEGADGEASGGMPPPRGRNNGRRLFRHPEDKWIGGVFGGLAAYFGTDPLWMRLLFILLVIFGVGSPLFIYLIMWILVPVAGTPAERLMMEGEPVTVDNLKRAFEEGAERVAREADELGRRWTGPQGQHYRRQATAGVDRAARTVADVFAKLVGIALLLAGTILTVILVGLLLGGGTITYDSITAMGEHGLLELAGAFFESPGQGMLTILSAITLALVPALGLFIGGFRLLTGLRAPAWLGWILTALWIAALAVMMFTTVRLVHDHSNSQRLSEEVPLVQPAGQTVYVDVDDMRGIGKDWNMSYSRGRVEWDMDALRTTADSIHIAWARLDVTRSPDDQFHLLVERRAQGRNEKMAMARASHTRFSYHQQDSLLRFSPWVDVPKDDKFRLQRVRFVLQVPVGRAVHFQGASGILLDDVANVSGTSDANMVGRTWTMTPNGLSDRVRPEDVPDDLRPAPTVAPGSEARLQVKTTRPRFVLPDPWVLLRPAL